MQWRSSPRLRRGVRAARADIKSALWEAALTPLAFRISCKDALQSDATSVSQLALELCFTDNTTLEALFSWCASTEPASGVALLIASQASLHASHPLP
jgi:hypothetical protein